MEKIINIVVIIGTLLIIITNFINTARELNKNQFDKKDLFLNVLFYTFYKSANVLLIPSLAGILIRHIYEINNYSIDIITIAAAITVITTVILRLIIFIKNFINKNRKSDDS